MQIKIAAISPAVSPGAVTKNTQSVINALEKAANMGICLAVLPQNCLTGDIAGLREFPDIKKAVVSALKRIASATEICAVIGFPYGTLDCAALMEGGKIRCMSVLNSSLFNNSALGSQVKDAEPDGRLDGLPFKLCDSYTMQNGINVRIAGQNSLDVDYEFQIECGEINDEPSKTAIAKNMTVTAIPACYPAYMGGFEQKQLEAQLLSLKNKGGCIVVASTGIGESTFRYVRSSDKIIAAAGQILTASDSDTEDVVSAVYDAGGANGPVKSTGVKYPAVKYSNSKYTNGKYWGSRYPDGKYPDDIYPTGRYKDLYIKIKSQLQMMPSFLPKDGQCAEVWDILARGIYGRMCEAGVSKVMLGLSGGLDSASVLLTAIRTFDKYGLDRRNIVTVRMPGAPSGERTQGNALILARELDVTDIEFPIKEAVKRHLKRMGHNKKDVVYENAQARERGRILLDLANKHGALVLGTSDLSETALGWSTYGGDQLAHYNPNSSLTKSAIRLMLKNASDDPDRLFRLNERLKTCLADILDTPISPELRQNQRTEDIIGPYVLHEFFLLRLLAYREDGNRIIAAAKKEFDSNDNSAGNFTTAQIRKYYRIFISRFFKNRFKNVFACDGVQLVPYGLTQDIPPGLNAELWEI